jgi:hypothetical protein
MRKTGDIKTFIAEELEFFQRKRRGVILKLKHTANEKRHNAKKLKFEKQWRAETQFCDPAIVGTEASTLSTNLIYTGKCDYCGALLNSQSGSHPINGVYPEYIVIRDGTGGQPRWTMYDELQKYY